MQYMIPDSLSTWMQRGGRGGRNPLISAKATLLVEKSVFQRVGKKTSKEGDPIRYKKEIDEDFRLWIGGDECCRDTADKHFDNPIARQCGYH